MKDQNIEEHPPYTLQWFEKNVVVFDNKENKLLFENNRSKVQKSPFAPGSYSVVEWSRHHEQYDIQVTFSPEAKTLNNHYLILIYFWEEKEILMTGYKSHTSYPPVWERGFSFGPDYYDYVATQKFINNILKSRNLPELEIDMAYDGKVINMTMEKPEEIEKLLAEGKSYTVLSTKAEAFFEKAKITSIERI